MSDPYKGATPPHGHSEQRNYLLAGFSPALHHFRDHRPADGLIDARDCRMFWNDADDSDWALNGKSRRHGACDVTVVWMPIRLAPVGHPIWTEWGAYDRLWQHATGNTARDWMSGRPEGTPEAVFAYLRDEEGFASEAERVRAVRQFAKIRECGWARDMLGNLPATDRE